MFGIDNVFGDDRKSEKVIEFFAWNVSRCLKPINTGYVHSIVIISDGS